MSSGTNLVDSLRERRDATPVVVLRFMLDYQSGARTIHAFFEGRDDESFYVNFITWHCPVGWKIALYRCGNKAKVCDVWRRTASYDSGRLLFFVDKDHDDLVGRRDAAESAANVFVTEWYSIENYLVCVEIVRRYLRDILHADLAISDEDAVCDRFLLELRRFHTASRTVHAWIMAMRRSNYRVTIANIEMSDLFEVDSALTIRRRRVRLREYLWRKCSVSSAKAWNELLPVVRELSALPPKRFIRGKFELWFLVAFLLRMPDVLSTKFGVQACGVKTHLTHSNAVEVLGPRLPIPPGLNAFLVTRLDPLK